MKCFQFFLTYQKNSLRQVIKHITHNRARFEAVWKTDAPSQNDFHSLWWGKLMEVNQLFSQTVPTTTFSLKCPALKIILTISFRNSLGEGLVTRDPPPLPQRPKEDILLGGYHIPGCTCQMEFLVYQMGRNESIFEDAEAFKPERWLRNKDTASIEAAGAFASLQFGFGTHMYLSRRIVEWSSFISLTHGGRECGAVHERGHHSWQTC